MDITQQAFYETLEEEYKEENLIEYIKDNRSFTYLKDYFVAESYIAGRIGVMKAFFKDNTNNYNSVIDLEEERKEIKYETLQRKAISMALSQGFIILTGGPGTGKTTTFT